MICRDVAQHLYRMQRMQSIFDLPCGGNGNLKTDFTLSIIIGSTGTMDASTYPINLFTRGFQNTDTSKHDILRLPVDSIGNRHIIQVN